MPPETEVKPIQCARGVGERKENYAQRPSPPSLEGGINGRKLELIEYDACDPDRRLPSFNNVIYRTPRIGHRDAGIERSRVYAGLVGCSIKIKLIGSKLSLCLR